MSVTYDQNATIHDMPVTRYRDILRSWDRNRNIRKLTQNLSLSIDKTESVLIIDDAEARGLFEYGRGYGPTEAGRALLGATPTKPIPAEKARVILKELIARCAEVNADKSLPLTVDKVWLYGSLVKGKEAVNDVDVVIESRWDMDAPEKELIERAVDAGGRSTVMAAWSRISGAREFLWRRSICGGRRHPRLSVNDSPHELIAMHQSCQLVFDASRGGPVSDVVLDHHPDSKKRSKTMSPQAVMPDLAEPAPMVPVRANRVHDTFHYTKPIGPHPLGTLTISSGEGDLGAIRGTPLEPLMARLGDVDGRSLAVIAVYPKPEWGLSRSDLPAPVGAVVVARSYGEHAGTIKVEIREAISFTEAGDGHSDPDEVGVFIAKMVEFDVEKVEMLTGIPTDDVVVTIEDRVDNAWSRSISSTVEVEVELAGIALDWNETKKAAALR